MSWVLTVAGWVSPVVVGVLVLAAIYKLLPNTRVRYRAAVGGAVVSVPLWLAAKWGFAVYVTELVGTGNLYGAIGLLPLFLVWLNLSWMIFLFGAELAHTAVNLADIQATEQAKDVVLGPSDLLAAAITVARPYHAGEGPVRLGQIVNRLCLPTGSVQWLLDRLASANVVCPVEGPAESGYTLARPAERISVLEVLGVDNWDRASSPRRRYDSEITRVVTRARDRARSALGAFTLADAISAAQG